MFIPPEPNQVPDSFSENIAFFCVAYKESSVKFCSILKQQKGKNKTENCHFGLRSLTHMA